MMRIRTIHKRTVNSAGEILPEWETPYSVVSYPGLNGYASAEEAKREILRRNKKRNARVLDDGSIRVEGDAHTYQIITFGE